MKVSAWKTALIDVDRATEFTGDDKEQYSELVDLKENCEFLTVRLPALDNATINPVVQEGEGVDEVPVPVHALDADATGSFLHATSAGTTAKSVTFWIGGYQFIRIKAGATQASDRSIKVRGFNRTP